MILNLSRGTKDKIMSKSTSKIVAKYIGLGKNAEDVSFTFCKIYRRHQYRIWQGMKSTFGYPKGKEIYQSLWGGGERVRLFREMNRENRFEKGAVDVAEAIAENWRECGMEPAFVTEGSNKIDATIEINWCPNPVFCPRPWDLEKPNGNLETLEFGYVDCYEGTVALIDSLIKSLPHPYKYAFEVAQTLNMGHPVCRFLFRKVS